MDYSKAKKAIDAAEAKAKELGVTISVAVVDQYGDLVAFNRMEGALKISPKFAIAKAYTAGTMGMKTTDVGQYATEGKPLYGVESLFGGELTTIGGGIPVMKDKQLIGGVGVGGSYDVKQDIECAEAAAAELS